MASILKPNLKSFFNKNLYNINKDIYTNWVNYFRYKFAIEGLAKYSLAKQFLSSSIIHNRKINNLHLMFFTLSKLWKELSIFLTSTFKRKKLKMKKHKTAKRIKKLRNIFILNHDFIRYIYVYNY